MTFVESENKSTTSWTNPEDKSSTTFTQPLKHGKEPTMEDLAGFTFTDEPYDDGRKLEDLTFEDMADQSWTNENKS